MSLQSMTGYASAQSLIDSDANPQGATRLGMEIRSVNSRYLDLSFRLPEELRHLEPNLRELVHKRIKRGKVELRIGLEVVQSHNVSAPDSALLQHLANVQNQVRMWLPEAPPLSVSEVIRWMSPAPSLPMADLATHVMPLADEVLTQLSLAREREGAKLADDLLARVRQLQTLSSQTLPWIPTAVAAQKQKFLDRWREALALADAQSLPEAVHERALAEAASFAVRTDVAEEVTRLTTHLSEIERLLQLKNHPEGVGKRLDFLIQELHREANTLGSKSSTIELTRLSLDMKVLIEQMREQVQNLE